jgi:hypothetical protein
VEQLFGTQLKGVFKEAMDFASEELELSSEEAGAMEEITKGIQLVVELAALPLEAEINRLKEELTVQEKSNQELYNIVKQKNDQISELEYENRNLLQSLKYLKEVSEKQDLVNDNVIYLSTHRRK